jgi:glycosyltransferase involved in cell wall biosynthesis
VSTAPLISVILPVFDGARFVGRALDSVFAQTHRDFEVIAIDDGSTDRTREILDAAGDAIRVCSQPNRGAYAARNLGLRLARGELVAFLDADDAWHPRRLESQLRLIDGRPEVGLVFGDGVIEREGVRERRTFFDRVPPRRGHVFLPLVRENFIPQSSVLARRRCFDVVGPFREVRRAADYHKWLQIARHYELDFVDGPVFTYALHDANLSADFAAGTRALLGLFDELAGEARAEDAHALRQRRLDLEVHLALWQARRGRAGWLRALRTPAGVGPLARAACLARVLGAVAAHRLRPG